MRKSGKKNKMFRIIYMIDNHISFSEFLHIFAFVCEVLDNYSSKEFIGENVSLKCVKGSQLLHIRSHKPTRNINIVFNNV